MDFAKIDFTQIVEKILEDLFKNNKRPINLYHKYWNPANFAIVGVIGLLIYYTINTPFQTLFGWIGNMLSIVVAWFWIWSMSVGPFGYMWGFREKDTSHLSKKTNVDDKNAGKNI